MSLSESIKKLRIEKGMTQEQLASSLGVSPQAVSKWETNATYPDGALLVPLAKQLGVSLDELFENQSVYMADVAKKVIRLIYQTKAKQRFHVAREICWHIECGLCGPSLEYDKKYDPDDLKNRHNSSYVLNDYGFTVMSNGKEPFFSIFPEPEEGFRFFLKSKEDLQKTFLALSSTETITALIYLFHQKENYIFESSVLARACAIPESKISEVMNDLLTLRVVCKQTLSVNGGDRTLYYSNSAHKLIALFLMAKEVGYPGAHCMTLHDRKKPLLK